MSAPIGVTLIGKIRIFRGTRVGASTKVGVTITPGMLGKNVTWGALVHTLSSHGKSTETLTATIVLMGSFGPKISPRTLCGTRG